MTQYARPNGDRGDAEWVRQDGNPSILWQLIDEAVTDNDNYMKSVADGFTSPAYCKIALANTVTDPDTALDDHKVKYVAIGGVGEMSMMGVPALTVQLHDTTITDYANNPIAEHTNSGLGNEDLFESYATFTITLSSTEAGNILSYDDLEIWFLRAGGAGQSGDKVKVSQAWFECADVVAGEADTTGSAFLLFME